ncbi:surfeit locus protein 1-like [Tubulanus polymorphus]|uniref:surfeit locus protein 1-like n=1 Tax=Tubulanus polymorphus TaxID=672921 RepID=UPI003DA1DD74
MMFGTRRILQASSSKINRLVYGGNTKRRCMSIHLNSSTSKPDRAYVLLVVPAACLGLGIWQIRRRQWKLDLIAGLEERSRTEPIPYPLDLEEIKSLEYRKVIVEGEFDHSRTVYIGPRSLLEPEKENKPGTLVGSTSQSGVHVITPFKLKHRNLTILVNRGWVRRKYMYAETKPGEVTRPVKLVGVVRLTEKRQPFGAKNPCVGLEWQRRDIEMLSDELGTAPFFIDADFNSTVENGPIGGQTRITMRNEHLSYIFTWFSLGGATLWMWFNRFGRRV